MTAENGANTMFPIARLTLGASCYQWRDSNRGKKNRLHGR